MWRVSWEANRRLQIPEKNFSPKQKLQKILRGREAAWFYHATQNQAVLEGKIPRGYKGERTPQQTVTVWEREVQNKALDSQCRRAQLTWIWSRATTLGRTTIKCLLYLRHPQGQGSREIATIKCLSPPRPLQQPFNFVPIFQQNNRNGSKVYPYRNWKIGVTRNRERTTLKDNKKRNLVEPYKARHSWSLK